MGAFVSPVKRLPLRPGARKTLPIPPMDRASSLRRTGRAPMNSGSPEAMDKSSRNSRRRCIRTRRDARAGRPDGTQIAYSTRPQGGNTQDIFVIPAAGGAPRQLTADPASDSLPSWSHDGNWIYFQSNRTGTIGLWKVPSKGGPASQVTRTGASTPVESPDGQWLYFVRGDTLYRMPTAGGDEQEMGKANSFLPTSRGVYTILSETGGRSATVRLHPISGGAPKMLGKIVRPFHNGLSLSPDFKYLLFSQYDVSSADIMLVENFR